MHSCLQMDAMEIDQPNLENPETGFRWTYHLRTHMVRALLGGLTWDQAEDVICGTRKWPNRPDIFTPIYAQLTLDVHAYCTKHFEGSDAAALPLPSKRAIRETAKRWAKAFLERGNVFDKPAHEKGWQLKRNLPHLQTIRAIIMKGW